MIREVLARDGRSWQVHGEINWRAPSVAREFEHDVAAGQVAGVIMLLGLGIVLLILVFGEPPGVFFPLWLKLLFLAVALVVPAHWVVNRQWTIVAETRGSIPGDEEYEYWEGAVRGFMAARDETSQAVQSLEEDSTPDDGRGILQRYPEPP